MTSVLLLTPATSRPAPESLRKLENEYSFRDELDTAWAVRPLTLSKYDGQKALVLKDPGGELLHHLIQGPAETGRFLRMAVGLASALSELHKRKLVHKDLKPSNVLVDSATGQVWLTGFGIASRLPRERQSLEPPEFIAGTLAYMAPEQTGRMNRSIDSRSDLYALGVTLYEMLTGDLPFRASDPMEWVHCHIARHPVPPHERVKSVPVGVSAIVMKLLAKTPEERYQTASGVESDLRRCLAEWEAQGCIADFSPGQHDAPDRLLIPEKLYGRERDIKTLLTAFDRVVAGGRPELVLVSGYSGIGKSSVVHELHKVLVPPRGLFASGKFDQYKRDIPYATLAQAFQSLVRPLLSKTEAELRIWRAALLEALGPNGRLMVDVVPELKLIIGEPPPVPELPPQDAQRRFQLVFRRFIGVYARPEHPLALFLDDLQWLDAATLDLLEDLLTQSDLQHLLLIGAYRDNEVTVVHPLMRKLETIKNAGGRVAEIALAPLAREHLGQLIADALCCELNRAAPLAQLVHEKTGGNPFFAIQFISSLADERMLAFDHAVGRWSWDLDRIHARGYTDNVVDLMVGRLARLPAETQNALRQMACLGNIAEITTLAIVLGLSEEQLHTALYPAVLQELVERLAGSYRFVHDRVQEGAYSLIPEELRHQAHLRIGRLLVARLVPEKREEAIFDIVNQLNRGSHLITSAEESRRLAELNRIAGRRAKSSAAYASALAYLGAARKLLTEESWNENYELIFSIEFDTAECELLSADLVAAEKRLSTLAGRAKTEHDVAIVTRLRLTLYTTLDRSNRAVEVCLEYLRRGATDWSPHPTSDDAQREYDRIFFQIGSRRIEDLIDLPLMTNPDVLDALDVLAELVTPAVFSDANLSSLVICRMVNLSLKYGNSDGSCFAYVWFAIIAGPRFANYRDGFRFGRLGYDLVEKRGLKRFQARTYMSFGDIVMPWTRHVRAGRDLVRRAIEAANEIGDLTFAGYCWDHLVKNMLAAGDQLVKVQGEAEDGLQFAQKVRFGLVMDQITAQLGLIRTLRGLTQKFGSFNNEGFDELRFERRLANNPALAEVECWYSVRKLQARFFAGDYASAVDASLNAQRQLWTSPSQFETAELSFYGALSHAASWDSASLDQRQWHFEALTAHHRQLEIWAEYCPENFESRVALAGAEIARIEGRVVDAEGLYEKAIHSAHANGFIHNEAVANELAARFYAARGFEKIADAYLREARYCYLRWGADGKVRQLDELYPHLRKEEPTRGASSTIVAPGAFLDLATVIKVSQAVSGEMVLKTLIEKIMRAAIEHAGGERGLLIFPLGDELQIKAEATSSGNDVTVQLRDDSVTTGAFPESIVRYVLRTREDVILDDASAENPFSADAYISKHRVRSIVCLPLINQGRLNGVIYLENDLATRVFTSDRITVLKVLASQAAMSLENTRLYRDLENREAKIRRLVDANILGIFIWNLEGAIVESNEAFLRMVLFDREDIASGRVRWRDLTPAEWREHDERALAEIVATGSVQPYEKELFRKDGSRLPVLVAGALFERGGREGVAFALDVSERKRAEEALHRSESYLTEAQRLTLTGSCAIDGRSRETVYWSEEMFRLFGLDPHQGLPTWDQWFERVHPEDRDKVKLAGDRTFLEKIDCDVEFRLVKADGTIKHIHGTGHPVLNRSGDLDQVVGTMVDITERRRAEEARDRLRQLEADLAHINRVSTMGELTASLAHEINQPIGAAVTNAQACLRFLNRGQPDVAEAREAALEMVREAKRAADIIERVRSLFRKGPPHQEMIDVNEVIREMVVILHKKANRYLVEMHTELCENLPNVLADRVQLQQVLMNLMINGIEAMRDAGGELSIKSRLAEDGQLLISVSDTGVGLPTGKADEIFNAFFTTKSQGTGLGLAITRSIVESHGGRVWASANSRRGATVQFTLPQKTAAHA
ncbi:MAG TPA: AAA family ATPase [Candidatus Acidoferrum sp.]